MTNRADNFNRTDSSTLGTPSDSGSSWVEYGPTGWGVNGNRARHAAVDAQQACAALESSVANVTVKGTLAVLNNSPNAEQGLVARLVDASNFWRVIHRAGDNRLVLQKRVSGSYTTLSNTTVAYAANDTMELEADSSSKWVVRKNGSNVVTGITDTAHSTATLHGLAAHWNSGPDGARWDDFSITEIGGGALGGLIGIATETDTALTLGRAKFRAISAALESDSAIALGRVKQLSLATAAETDSAIALSRAKARALGFALEADSAIALSRAKTRALSFAAETDAAIALGRSKAAAIGLALETDTALTITSSGAKVIAVNTAFETDTAIALSRAKARAIAAAVETDAAQVIGRAKARALGAALEADLAIAIARAKARGVGLATEIDVALPITLAGAPLPARIAVIEFALAKRLAEFGFRARSITFTLD